MIRRPEFAMMCLALALLATPAAAQNPPAAKGPDLKVIARQMVRDVARVRAGDNVFITGDVRDMEMLEHLAVEVRKLGAAAVIILGHHNAMSGREEFQRRLLHEVPAEHDDKNLPLELKLWQLPNVHIYFGGRELPDLFTGVSARRFTTYEKVRQALERQFATRSVRRVLIDLEIYPTAAVAKKHAMTREQLAAVFWRAMAADPATIRATAEAVRATLAQGRVVRITNPNGTDLTVRVQGRPVLANDGVLDDAKVRKGGAAVWAFLPAGDVAFVPVPDTAEGTVVVDRMIHANEVEVEGLRLVFKAGKLVQMTGKPGRAFDRFKAIYEAAPAARRDELGVVDVGVNRGLTIPKGSKFLPWAAAGMVSFGFGNNVWAGGDNPSTFEGLCHLPGSTLTVDGTPLVERGVLKLPGARGAR